MAKKTVEKDVQVKHIFQPTDGRTKFIKPYMVPGAEVTIVRIRPNTMSVQFGRRSTVDIVAKDFIKKVKIKKEKVKKDEE